MAFLNYKYKMRIVYSEPVNKCYFTIKSVPAEDFRQKNISYQIRLFPQTTYSEGKDSFGNVQLIGSVPDLHSMFDFEIRGLVETHPVNVIDGIHTGTLGMYKYPHGKCIPGDSIKNFANQIAPLMGACKDDLDKCRFLMNELYMQMTYEPGFTGVETTAEEAFTRRTGVCQDYAHIFICLLRLFSIPARYVCGLIVGEGASHAWVEAVCNGGYVAFDPTNNQEITDEYIKLSVGRDAVDCAINRGVMWGGGNQTQEISVKVEKHY